MERLLAAVTTYSLLPDLSGIPSQVRLAGIMLLVALGLLACFLGIYSVPEAAMETAPLLRASM